MESSWKNIIYVNMGLKKIIFAEDLYVLGTNCFCVLARTVLLGNVTSGRECTNPTTSPEGVCRPVLNIISIIIIIMNI